MLLMWSCRWGGNGNVLFINQQISFKRGEICDRLHWRMSILKIRQSIKEKTNMDASRWMLLLRTNVCFFLCLIVVTRKRHKVLKMTSCLSRGFFIFIPQATAGATRCGKSHFSLFLKRPYACFLFSVCNESLQRINIWSFSLSPRRSFLWESEEVWTGSDQRDVADNTPHVTWRSSVQDYIHIQGL